MPKFVNTNGIIATALVLLAVFSGCKKDASIVNTTLKLPDTANVIKDTAGDIIMRFNLMANSKTVTPVAIYKNQSNEKFTISKFNYYISNVHLKKADGTTYIVPESYYLIRHMDGITSFTLKSVPSGTYTSFDFLIGVDSLRNVSGIQSGALDPANNMFWDWNTGYIFFKMEGTFVSLASPDWSDYAIHLGGFQGPYKCLQNYQTALSTPVIAHRTGPSTIHMNVLADEVFIRPDTISFDKYYSNVNEKMFKAISDNYRDMFIVDRVEN
jgi:hypothetical protein